VEYAERLCLLHVVDRLRPPREAKYFGASFGHGGSAPSQQKPRSYGIRLSSGDALLRERISALDGAQRQLLREALDEIV
jgi:hypothetical protein